MERAPLSLHGEASRARDWCTGAVRERHLPSLTRQVVAGTANVVAAAADPWRRPQWWCPCCDRLTGAFLWVGNELRLTRRSACAGCGSRSRHRGLALLLRRLVAPDAGRVLHFAPEPPLRGAVRSAAPDAEVVTTDLHRTDVDRPGEDIQALGFADDEFDVVLCNHVLEHVVDDRAAVAELARITRPEGIAVLSVPGDWDRAETVTFAEVSPNGHHRDYGTDVVDLLASAFADVEVVVLGELDLTDLPGNPGLQEDDRLFVCRPA